MGCGPKAIERPGNAVLVQSSAVLEPVANPDDRAVLRLGAPPGGKRSPLPVAEFQVALRRKTDGPKLVMSLLAGGELLERETYDNAKDAFRAVEASDERFDPPLDLLRYPVRDGAAWGWTGKVVYAGRSRDARAQVTVAPDGGDVRSDIALAFSADSAPSELKRNFTFWFRKGHGVVRRAFGDASSRRPVGEPWRP